MKTKSYEYTCSLTFQQKLNIIISSHTTAEHKSAAYFGYQSECFRCSESLHPKCASTVHNLLHSFLEARALHSSCRRGGRGRSATTWHGISNQQLRQGLPRALKLTERFKVQSEMCWQTHTEDMLAGYSTHDSMFLVLCCSESVALPWPGLASKKVPNIQKNPCSTAGLSSMFNNDNRNPISHPAQQ